MAFLVKTSTDLSTGDADADIYFGPVILTSDTIVSFQLAWTGATTGTLYLQVSNDGVNYITTSEVFPNNPAGATGSTAEVWSGFGYKYARVFYDFTSSTPQTTMTCYAEVKRA